MKYIIDTHALLWIITNDPKLSSKAKKIYLNPKNIIYFSMAGIWEIAIKISLNKMTVGMELNEFVKNHIIGNDIKILNIELSHVLALEKLPFHHRDPFDRLLICQSGIENIPVISSDRIFDQYSVKRIW